jgi:hypothetical protein
MRRPWYRSWRARPLLFSLLSSAGAAVMILVLGLLPPDGHAAAPAGRYTLSADTVYDTATTLTWERNLVDQRRDWAGAKAYCQGLGLAGAVWRVPTIAELESIVDVSVYNWALDSTAFPRPASPSDDWFWASTEDAAGATTSAWTVDFYHGNSGTKSKSSSGYVRCVH